MATLVLQHLKSKYIKATFEFVDFVLADLTGLKTLFKSNDIKLYRLLPEGECVIRMFCKNFMKTTKDGLTKVDVDKADNWLPFDGVYPRIWAHETANAMLPQERGSFLSRCHNWYREVVHQIVK